MNKYGIFQAIQIDDEVDMDEALVVDTPSAANTEIRRQTDGRGISKRTTSAKKASSPELVTSEKWAHISSIFYFLFLFLTDNTRCFLPFK